MRLLSAALSPCLDSCLHRNCVSFHYSYFMCYQKQKKECYFLHGGGQVMAGSQVAPFITSWSEGSFSHFMYLQEGEI